MARAQGCCVELLRACVFRCRWRPSVLAQPVLVSQSRSRSDKQLFLQITFVGFEAYVCSHVSDFGR
jgi:hypothetical protein